MTDSNEIYREPKYTMRWLMLQTIFVLVTASVLALVSTGIDSLIDDRIASGQFLRTHYDFVSQSATYSFAVIAITLISLLFIEVIFRKEINFLQYGLIACALCLFNLLLLAMAEQLYFWVAYGIVAVMTIALISWFVYGITKQIKASLFATALLAVEYGLILVLLYMGSMALLVGSLSLFLLIAVAMYFTLKLKVENEELVLK